MSVTLALLALLIELCAGYPDALLRTIGHPVTWIGRLIAALDRVLNRDDARRAGGEAPASSILLLVGVVGAIAFIVERAAPVCRSAWSPSALVASTLIAQRSLHQHVADVADRARTRRPRRRPRRGRARSSAAIRTRSTRPASRAPRSRAWPRIFPTASSRRCSGWRSRGLPGAASTRRSTPPTA